MKPRLLFVGKFKSGKTAIVDLVAKNIDTVVIRIKDVLELFAKNPHSGLGAELNAIMRAGKQISDELLVEILA